MKSVRSVLFILSLSLLSGCWDSVELDESIMVVGVGVDKDDDGYNFIIEAIAPSDISPTELTIEGDSILLEAKSETFFNAARDIIRIAKRRLFFTHTDVWVIDADLAMNEDVLSFLDIIRREQMLRLNSYLFISDDPPKEIFSTDYTFSKILSEELLSGVEYAEYVSDYPSVRARDFFKRLLSPLRSGYLPTIKTIEQNGKKLSQLTGSAIFNSGYMVGKLNARESLGLMWLNDEVQGGSITLSFDDDSKASFKLIRSKVNIDTKLDGNDLTVDMHVKAEGNLADQFVQVESINEWIKNFEKKVSEHIQEDIRLALQKLQNEYNTDATLIGVNAYRKQTKQFNQVIDHWDDVFSEATINLKVDTKVTDKGLIEGPGYQDQKQNKIYQFN